MDKARQKSWAINSIMYSKKTKNNPKSIPVLSSVYWAKTILQEKEVKEKNRHGIHDLPVCSFHTNIPIYLTKSTYTTSPTHCNPTLIYYTRVRLRYFCCVLPYSIQYTRISSDLIYTWVSIHFIWLYQANVIYRRIYSIIGKYLWKSESCFS